VQIFSLIPEIAHMHLYVPAAVLFASVLTDLRIIYLLKV